MATKRPTSNYWERRFTAMDDAMYKKSEAYIKDLGKRFERATKQMSKDMAYWYTKLAENNEISYAAAKKLLAKDELEDFHITLEEYIRRGEELDLNPEWRKRLVNASAKVHISRLEEMQLELQNTIENLYHDYESGVTQYLSELVPNTYYHTAYELAKGTGVAATLHKLDSEAISAYLTKPWVKDGKAFSGRIWERRDELVNTVNNQLAQLLITGKDPQKAIDTIARDFAVEKSAAGRLVMTESAALNNEARRQCMKDLDVEEYEVVATLDSKTSAICRSMDGQHFPMSQFKIGLNAPPFHCNCRSCTVPYFDDEFTQDETRAARDDNDEGYVRKKNNFPGYEEWKNKYVKPNKSNVQEKTEGQKRQRPGVKEYVNIADIKKQNKTAGEQLEMLPQSHIDLLNEQNTQILFDSPGASNYNEVNKTLHLLDDLSDQELIHEVGHALEDRLKVWSDKEFLEIAKKVAGNNVCYYDPDTFVKPVWRIDSPLLISEYQGRVYEFPGSILEDGTANPIALGDLFSEAYAYYITTPLELKKCNSELYEYLRKVLPK